MHILNYGVRNSLFTNVHQSIRNNKKKSLALAMLALTSIAGSALYKNSSAYVTPIMRYDLNNDGKKEAVVAFPIPFTEKAILRLIDGNDLEDKEYKDSIIFPKYLKVNFLQTSHIDNAKQHIVPKSYNNPSFSMRLLGFMATSQSDLEIILDEFNSESEDFHLSE